MALIGRGRRRRDQGGSALPAHRPPPSTVYRSFLYLDSPKLMDFLSVLRGGEILEHYLHGISEGQAGVEAQIGFAALGVPAAVKAGGRRRRTVEDRLRLATTIHSALAEVLQALEANGERLVVDSEEGRERVRANMLVELPYRRVARLDPYGLDPRGAPDRRSFLARLSGAEAPSPPRRFAALLDSAVGQVAIFGDGACLALAGEDFCSLRHATVLGQVECPEDGEVICAGPDSLDPRPALRDAICDRPGDAYHGSRFLLTPICIYK